MVAHVTLNSSESDIFFLVRSVFFSHSLRLFYVFLPHFRGAATVHKELWALERRQSLFTGDIDDNFFKFWRHCELKFIVAQHRFAVELFFCLFAKDQCLHV